MTNMASLYADRRAAEAREHNAETYAPAPGQEPYVRCRKCEAKGPALLTTCPKAPSVAATVQYDRNMGDHAILAHKPLEGITRDTKVGDLLRLMRQVDPYGTGRVIIELAHQDTEPAAIRAELTEKGGLDL